MINIEVTQHRTGAIFPTLDNNTLLINSPTGIKWVVNPSEKVIIQTGIGIKIPQGYRGRIHSIDDFKTLIPLFNGQVILSEQDNEINLSYLNVSDVQQFISGGTLLAKIIFEKDVEVNIDVKRI